MRNRPQDQDWSIERRVVYHNITAAKYQERASAQYQIMQFIMAVSAHDPESLIVRNQMISGIQRQQAKFSERARFHLGTSFALQSEGTFGFELAGISEEFIGALQ